MVAATDGFNNRVMFFKVRSKNFYCDSRYRQKYFVLFQTIISGLAACEIDFLFLIFPGDSKISAINVHNPWRSYPSHSPYSNEGVLPQVGTQNPCSQERLWLLTIRIFSHVRMSRINFRVNKLRYVIVT